ncbi:MULTISPECIES: nuclear transport factor 2 family protein [unclassified Leisingera]|uniref:nuclear transport factor 2 family protein n=1 Tax=unclassified Leisingera TaxID=2614906 RepID=UPI0002E2B896|nr:MULTISPECIES: nuclear transport factor 2 family protein [unclassified Leisingera]KIC22990.1 hypothetical protein RA23_16255 [Leisingera sp. ANG-S3]KIC52430.1 hypothetical protein RA22_16290 [Leisingera sp. ANG-S]KID07447.1 hypothetical protein GC1_19545 [Leisingera sp. ANG1]
MGSKEAIRKLINAYSFTLDNGDLEGFASLFSDAEWVFDEGKPYVGKQELMDKLLSRVVIHTDGTPRTRHLSTNEDITVDEAKGTACCHRYVTVIQQTAELPLQVIYSGIYLDEFSRNSNGVWRYRKLTINRPFFGDLNHHIRTSGG